MNKLITIFCKTEKGEKIKIEISPNKTIKDLKEIIKNKIRCSDLDLYFKDKKLNPSSTIFQSGLRDNDTLISKNETFRINEGKEYDYNSKLIFEGEYLNGEFFGGGIIYGGRGEGKEYEGEFLNDLKKEKAFIPKKKGVDIKPKEKDILEKIPIKKQEQEKGEFGEKEINIKFLKLPNKNNIENSNAELTSLLKLCLLKEISAKIDPDKLKKLPDTVKLILNILKNGYKKQTFNLKGDIKKILEKVKGSNIINFSKFVDESVNTAQLNSLIGLLNNNQKLEIKDIKNRLARYAKDIKIFDKQFAEAMKESIMEFSVISVAIIEREDFEKFEKEKKKCPNRVDKLLYHGTGEEPVACIMTDVFRKSIDKYYQHGRGVYFSDMLDNCWFYGDKYDNRKNINIIPQKDKEFRLIVCSTYYDKKGWKQVFDEKRTPKKNQINFAYAGAKTETLIEANESKFYGTEYVIWDLDQICPFIGAKLKRVEFCCIWRDTNFSKEIFCGPGAGGAFKKFFAERMKFLEQYAEFNIYPCETSEEALKLIKRKKYNKIILLSNIGQDLGGKEFVDEARKIIGNDVIVLFSAYDEDHLEWVKKYKNALFSNDPYLFEEYLKCFSPNFSENEIKSNILALKEKVENFYEVKFNFDNKFIQYPLYKNSGHYSDLTFN